MSAESEAFKASVGEMVKKAALSLGEHVDSVQIMITKYSENGDGNTLTYEFGTGNYYARLGQIREWLTMQEEFQRCWARERSEED